MCILKCKGRKNTQIKQTKLNFSSVLFEIGACNLGAVEK